MCIHGYGYYDTHTRLVNMWVLKILIPITWGYPFLTHCRFYPQIPAGTSFFDIPKSNVNPSSNVMVISRIGRHKLLCSCVTCP